MKEIKHEIESNIQRFQEILNTVNSFSDLCGLYDLPNNGKQHRYFKNLIFTYNLSISHWDRRKKIRKYEKIEKLCPVCDSKFISQKNHPRETFTCSRKCSNVYFTNKRYSNNSRKKISDSLNEYHRLNGTKIISKIICVICGKQKTPKRNTQKCCSNKCASKFRLQNPLYRKKISDGLRKAIEEGRFKGWGIHRKGQQPSYPEKFFMGVLDSRNIPYEYDEPTGKYHVDFALKEKMIALEIDGGQHKEKALKYRDDKKDLYLTENGWKVYRIPWKSINSESGKQYIKEKIDGFVEFYNKT